jgi:hypothetical protein
MRSKRIKRIKKISIRSKTYKKRSYRKSKESKRSSRKTRRKNKTGGVLPIKKEIQDKGVENTNYHKIILPFRDNTLPDNIITEFHNNRSYSFVIFNSEPNIFYLIKERGSVTDRPWIGHSSVLPDEERSKYIELGEKRFKMVGEGVYNANCPEDYVLLAGQCYFYNGKLIKLSNWSGHYPITFKDFQDGFLKVASLLPNIEIVDYLDEERPALQEKVTAQFQRHWEAVDASQSKIDTANTMIGDKTPDQLTLGEWEDYIGAAW